MNCTRSVPEGFASRETSRPVNDAADRLRRAETGGGPAAANRCSRRNRICGWAGFAALAVGLAACGEAEVDVTETLTEACTEARQILADAPTPADADSESAFVDASREATQTVATEIEDLGEQVDDPTLADMAWQLNNFPQPTDDEELLGVAHEASAAIVRLDRFAEALGVSQCGAPTWRPADWRAMADRLKEQQSEEAFRADLNQLCAETFPNPARLADGTALLNALVDSGQEESEDVIAGLLSRLHGLSNRPAEARRFLREFSGALPEMNPSENLEDDYLALLGAFIHVDSVVPNVIPDEPSTEFRRRVDPAFEELERAWGALDITCSA
jgi:hypothetical protein